MAALNYQSNDESMILQHGFFMVNGGCGYRLKASFLINDDDQSVDVKQVRIRIISAQHLPKKNLEDPFVVDPFVKVSIFGIESDCQSQRSDSVENNGLNPVWDHRMIFKIHRPELALILFEVRDQNRYSRSECLGQACFPIEILQRGFRHIKLLGKKFDFLHSTLFVHVEFD